MGIVYTHVSAEGVEALLGMCSEPLEVLPNPSDDPFCVRSPSAPAAELAALAIGTRIARFLLTKFPFEGCLMQSDCQTAIGVATCSSAAVCNPELAELARADI